MKFVKFKTEEILIKNLTHYKKYVNDDIMKKTACLSQAQKGYWSVQMREIDLKKTILKNGLRVITVKRDSDIFSLSAGINVGSLYEDLDNNGISHMIEHMLFKGTASRDMDRISTDIEGLAGDLDIYTTYHQTILSVSVMKDMGHKCIEVVSDMFMNSIFPKKEFNLEKKVIIEEIKMEKDDYEETSYLGMYRAVCPDIWYKYHIAGTIKSVGSIKSDDLIKYYGAYYVPTNSALCIVSPFAHEKVVEMVEGCFGTWKGEAPGCPIEIQSEMVPGRIVKHKKGIGQAHIVYGFDVRGISRREEIALVLLNRKIGAGPGSILFKELRDNKGYAYNVYSDMDLVKGLKMFYIYAAVSPENANDTINIIDDVISRFREKRQVINDEWMRLVRNIFITDTLTAMESSAHMADYLLDGELNHQNPAEYRNVLSIMEDISKEDVMGVGEKVLKIPMVYILTPKESTRIK